MKRYERTLDEVSKTLNFWVSYRRKNPYLFIALVDYEIDRLNVIFQELKRPSRGWSHYRHKRF